MTEREATVSATVFGAEARGPMPASRSWGVTLTLPDGRFATIEDGAGWLYRDQVAYDAYHREGDEGGVLDAREWSEWGVTEEWASSLAALIGGEAHQSGGNIWVVLYPRPDGRFIVLGEDGAEIYQSVEHYERYYDADWPEPEFVYFSDTPAKS